MSETTLFEAPAQPAGAAAAVGQELEDRPTAPLLDITVYGVPIAQGSHVAVVSRSTNRAMLKPSNEKRLRPWREAVKQAALDAIAGHSWQPLDCALYVELTFTMPRPQGHFGTGRNAGQLRASAPRFPTTKPDWDKLARALDSLTDAGVWRDDCIITAAHVRKVFPGTHRDALPSPGARIRIYPAEAIA